MSDRPLSPNLLWQRTLDQTSHALACGALQPVPTQFEWVEDHGVRFLVRILANLKRKAAAKQKQVETSDRSGEEFNPFLPYEDDLFVGDLSETHLCLLNKFNVVEHHLLIVTRHFEAQDTLLTLADFTAMWLSLSEIDGFIFYNGGTEAGASQKHKHLQLIPLPLTPKGPRIPIEPLVNWADFHNGIGISGDLPYTHAIAPLEPGWSKTPEKAAQLTFDRYRTLLRAVKLKDGDGKTVQPQSGAYNLLATREWMMIVPRSREGYKGIEVNSLGFAGTLLVRDADHLADLKAIGPMTLLTQVGKKRK